MLQNTTPNQDFIAPSETLPQSSSSTNLPIADLSDGMANLQLSSLKSFPNISPKLESTPLSTTAKSTQDEKIPTSAERKQDFRSKKSAANTLVSVPQKIYP